MGWWACPGCIRRSRGNRFSAAGTLFPREPGHNELREIEKENKMKSRVPAYVVGAIALALSQAASAADIVDTAVAGNFTTLVAAVKAAGLVDTLKGTGPFTVFAPTDAAFAKLPAG